MYLFCQNSLKTDKQIIFEHSSLGHLHKALPIEELSTLLPKKKNKSGAPSWVNSQGMIAMIFLQSYTQLSDRKFIDHLNGNWQMQLFCGMQLAINEPIRDRNMMSRIRQYVSEFLDLEEFQSALIKHWKPYMADTHVGMSDATVYESHMRYPTDVKLLWECCEYVQKQQEKLCDLMQQTASHKQFDKKKRHYLAYARRRKKPYKLTRQMRKNLLGLTQKLVSKLQGKLDQYLKANPISNAFTSLFEKLRTIKQIISQQQYLLTHKDSKLPDRILSLYKPYVRAIVRGKETKAVEFGAKVHMLQIDGVNYIEHFTYNAFNETTRLKQSILKHKQLFGKCTHWSADAIYASNKNRKYVSSSRIITNFVKKGPSTEDLQEKQIKSILNKERSTRLEGSFGVEKNYYGLAKVKARKKKTESLCIYFGVMTANAVRIARRIEQSTTTLHKKAA
jgi:transposase, IS5 family